MRIYELLNEDDSNNAGQGGSQKKSSKSGNVHDHYQSAIKGMHTYPGNHTYYDMYRFGVNMAGSPDDHNDYDPSSPVANQLVTLSYSDADQKIIDKSKKKMGFTSKQLTPDNSTEPNETHTLSPVAKIKRNKYGI
jgi:hypothetical protein